MKHIEGGIGRLHGNGQADHKQKQVIDDLVELERELKTMREELLCIAKIPYKLNQNDGFVITVASLRRFFRH
jgi:hypothetical protein